MTTDDRWTLLKSQARQQLDFVNKPNFLESFIEYESEPSFDPIFNLQIIWTDKYVKWSSTEWNNHVDWSKLYDSDGKTRVVLSQPEPTIKTTNGTASLSDLVDIVACIRTLKISPRVDPLKMFTLDGSVDRISLGVESFRTTYTWHTLPDEWKELRQLADNLIALKDRLQQR